MAPQKHWLIALACVGLWACKKTTHSEAYLEEVARYVGAYTGGAIGRNDAILVRFTRAVVGREQVGQPVPSGVWSVSPQIPATATWQDEYTLHVQPKAPLPYGKRYSAEVSLGKLFPDVREEAQTFQFAFLVRPLSFEVEIDGLQSEESAPNRYQVIGRLRTSDAVDAAAVEKVLSAQQEAENLPIQWAHSADGLEHTFTVGKVARRVARSAVMLRWLGKPLGLNDEGSQTLRIPAQGEFTLLSAQVMAEESPYALLNFSDPVSTETPLDGLIHLDDPEIALRFSVNGNFVRVYPAEPLSGVHQLHIERGILSVGGTLLEDAEKLTLDFGVLRPAVRLVGRGAIVPKNSDGQILFPFEATGLRAVDLEIFKVFQSNVLHFLQINDIEGDQELERVGKIIHQQKIDLSELNPRQTGRGWQRYALDLAEFIKKDPGAIYQVRLSFRRSYTTQRCSDAAAEQEEMAQFGATDAEGRLISLWGGYRGIYFSDDWSEEDGYEWDKRENPCAREYYNADHFVRRNVFVSDLGITAKWGSDRSLFVCTTDLLTAQPEGSVKITALNYQLQLIAEAQTSGDGTVYLENLREKPFLVAAMRGDRRGYVRLADGTSLSLSRFDVSGTAPQKGIKGYLYGERGVWRPGDSLFLHFVLEDKTGQLPPEHPVHFQLRDPRGTLYYQTTTAKSVGGVYAFPCATRSDAPTGNWTARVEVGGAVFTQTLKIEAIKPNRIQIALDFGKRSFIAEAEPSQVRLRARWLHGAPAAGLNARVELQLVPTKAAFKNFNDFVFDDPTRSFSAEAQTLFDSYLGDNGEASVPIRLGENREAPGRLLARFTTRVFERGGDFSTDNFAIDYFPYRQYVGVRLPQDKGGFKGIGLSGGQIQVACVDMRGNPLPRRKVSVGLYRCDWRWWWDEGYNYEVASFNTATHIGAIAKATLTTDERGIAVWQVRPDEWGRYLVRAVDMEGGHASGDFFWTGYPDDLSDLTSRQAVAMLPLSAEKERYSIGEKAVVRVPASDKGRILLTLENGSRVLEHRWFEAKAGDNLLTFQVGEQMVPNVYAHVNLFQPYQQTANDLPVRMYGVVPISVENPATHLRPELSAPQVIRPGTPFTVSLREAAGKACTYTLAVVDEGLLDLTRFQTPNPWNAFYAREALKVQTWDVFDYVLGAFGTGMERILSIGGDAAELNNRKAAQVSRFKPVVRHLGPFRLEKGQTAKHQLVLENYIGSVRIMAVCSAPALKGKGAYGSAEKTCAVRKPVMALPTLPRVLAPGETVRLPVEVFAVEQQVKTATVRLTEKRGTVRIKGPTSHTLSFAQPGSQLVYFDIQVGEKVGAAQFSIETNGGGETSQEVVEVEIRNPNPVQTSVWDGMVEGGRSWSVSVEINQYTHLERFVLEVSVLPPIHLSKHLDYLLRYPHGCLEQIVSGAFPQLYANLLAPLSTEQQKHAQQNIQAAIERIRRYQQPDGPFAYWPGTPHTNDWSSTYAGHFLLEAKAKGYAIPPEVLERWLDHLGRTARSWTLPAADPNPWVLYDQTLNQAYRLYVLALAGKPEMGSMNRLKEQKELHKQSALLLAAAYAQTGKAEIARSLAQKKWRDDWSYDWSGTTFGTTLRDNALALETFTALGDAKRAETLVQDLCQQLGNTDNAEWNTQSLAVALRALAKHVQKQGAPGPRFSYQINGGSAQKGDVNEPIAVVDLTDKAARARRIDLRNTGKTRLYARVIAIGQRSPQSVADEGVSHHVVLDVRYLDSRGNPIDIGQLTKGTDFVAEVTVQRQSDLSIPFTELALSQIFPSGWEIRNPRMSNGPGGSSSPATYQDIRDDRIYTYFDLPATDKRTYRILLHAAYAGRYYLPPFVCEAMYDSRIRASTTGRWVEVL